ncbi:MAG: helicase SNF2 [Betaproteobacteria bacterium HGW-Betaproteobacteria-10]|nr:MAG: helicase SNF2 [Betaproteobacteria bacterium HGW-Betaproteobacteria-10]
MKTKSAKTKSAKSIKEAKFSRLQPPVDISPLEWQRGLRRQFGREQAFGLENIGTERIFSEFRVTNAESKSAYRVAIRGKQAGDNFCACPDYATNELGTCKHIEFVLAALEKKRGARTAFARGYQPAFSELYLRHGGTRTVHFRAGTDCPPAVHKAAKLLFDAAQDWQLRTERSDRLDRFMWTVAKSGHELRSYDDALDFIAGRRDAEQRIRLLDNLFPRGAADSSLKNLLKVPLYPYQAEGAYFAVRAGRVLIGDEMGLGKTIQAIAAAEILARHFGVLKVLIICPTSLKYQWQSEIMRFSGRDAHVVAGGRAQRQKEFAQEDFCKITNYEKLQPDLDLITAWAPDLVIVDEAQRVKNWNTIAARALKRIDSSYAVVLTGTPLENKLEELISIVQFVDQYRLGPTWKLLHEHQVKDDSGRVTGYTGLEKIGQTLAPVMIRRRKSEVLMQLPTRTDQNLLVPMTELQRVYHQENAEVVSRIVLRWRKIKFLSDKDQRRLTCALQNMRMSCNSTYLLDHETDHGVKADELAALFDDLFLQPEAKAVVFSQWTRTHDIVIRRLEERGIGYVSFHGGISSEKRPALVERFRDDPACRVFLSTDAGSTGLNLQHASTLVNMDLPWNPAILEQRIGRIHRMGQKQPIQIINFVAKGTIEEGMLSVLAFKRSLSAGILDGATGEISLGGSRLNRFMKDVETVTGGMGEGEAMTQAEEAAGVQRVNEAPIVSDDISSPIVTSLAASEPSTQTSAVPPSPAVDPWQALLQVGTQLVSALGAARNPAAPAHPWIDRDPESGVPSLKMPLPSPETAGRIADALALLADTLRGNTR